MDFFFQCASVIGAIVLGIMVLTIFFKLIGRLERSKSAVSIGRRALEGLFDEATVATVYLSEGTVLEDVRFVGVTDASATKEPHLHELNRMLILEHRDGRKTVVPPKAIRRIELPAAVGGGAEQSLS